MKVGGIRVDGGFHIGLGHVYKCIWLAEALRKKGYEIVFLTTEDPVATTLIQRKNFPLHLLPASKTEDEKVKAANAWVRTHKPAFLIIDHWDWPKDYWVSLEKKSGTLSVGIDVPAEGFYNFDLAFQGIRNSLTNLEFAAKGCKVYEGPKYLMLCPDYQPYTQSWKPASRLQNILLTFGGTDVANFSLKILDYFEKFSQDFNLTLVLGPGSSIFTSLEKRLQDSTLQVEILRDVSCLPAYMSRSDLVISTAGAGTLSELALTGAPAIVFAAVPHQMDNARKFSQVGGILNCAGKAGVIDEQFTGYLSDLAAHPHKLNQLSKKWHGLVDTNGIERMVRILERHIR